MALREISQKAFHSYWNDADEDTTEYVSSRLPVRSEGRRADLTWSARL